MDNKKQVIHILAAKHLELPPNTIGLLADQIDIIYQLEIAELKERVDAWENLEASVCPEDVGLVEYIKSLVKQVEKLKEQWEWSQGALDWRESEIVKARADQNKKIGDYLATSLYGCDDISFVGNTCQIIAKLQKGEGLE